ncbi:MAG: DNA repair protein RadC [Clostridia bacterium]|nr:DNA repair protein RadC [Clostridia bacterium]
MGVHDGHRKRLKQQFLLRGDDFLDHQLLELLLCYAIPQGDVNELAHVLLDRFGSLAGICDALPQMLMQTPGIGEHTAVLLKLIPKLSGRYTTIRGSVGDILDSTQSACDYLRPYFQQGARNEMVYLVCMDAKCKVLGVHKLSEGSVNAADITPRKIAEVALAHNATSVILAHNHVSGIALPSNADLATTRKIFLVLRDLGIQLADHLIFADDDMVSIKDSGLLAGYPNE